MKARPARTPWAPLASMRPMSAPDSTPLSKIAIPPKWVLLMGHEGKGLSPEVLAACDETVQIEMVPGIRSFNVGVAASILMYQFKNRQQPC